MKNYLLFDDPSWDHLLPLTLTRPVCEIRVGIMTLRERWELLIGNRMQFVTQDYLSEAFSAEILDDNVIINGSVLANPFLAKLIQELDPQEALLYQDSLIAARLSGDQFEQLVAGDEIEELQGINLRDTPVVQIKHPWDIWQLAGIAIREDIEFMKLKPTSKIPRHCTYLGDGELYIDPSAQVLASTLNTTDGPIYIGPDAVIMEGSHLRGPLAIGTHSTVKMGTRITGDTSIGPHCKVGGEISNSVIFGFSNKGHDGYLGNSVIGEWCNLGADTNTSNLKNNYGEVSFYDYAENKFISSGSIFGGVIIGDHTKCSINTMINTGSSFGVGCNIYDGGFPPKVIPSFSWGNRENRTVYSLDKFISTAKIVMSRRQVELSDPMVRVLSHIHSTRVENL